MVSDKCVMTNICPDGIQNSLTSLKVPCVLFSHSCLELLATNDFFMISLVLLFPNCHIVGIIQCLPFSGWLFPLATCLPSLFHFFSWLDSSVHFSTEYFIWWMYHSLFIHIPTEGHLGLPDFGIYDRSGHKHSDAGLCVDKSLQFTWVKYQRSWLLDYVMSTFSFVRSCQTAYQSECTYHFALQSAVNQNSNYFMSS